MTTTPIDTESPAGLLRLANSFCDAKALLTAVELDLFGTLSNGPLDADGIRTQLGLHGRGLVDWLDLLVELGLLEKTDSRYGNLPGVDRYLVRDKESYIGGFMQRASRNLYPAWGRLSEALRTGKPQSGSSFDEVVTNPGVLQQFIHSMDALTRILGPQLLATYDAWQSHGSVLDIGGCRGSLVTRIVSAHPHLIGTAFDLPQMKPFFDEQAAASGVADRVAFHGGDFFTDQPPTADIVVMGHVLHDWDPDQRKQLIKKAYRSVNPGGVLLVYDRMLDRADSRVENLVISLDMLLVTDGGSEYWAAEVRDNATAAGFAHIEERSLGHDDTLVIAHKR